MEEGKVGLSILSYRLPYFSGNVSLSGRRLSVLYALARSIQIVYGHSFSPSVIPLVDQRGYRRATM